jgi:hypothetical protein
MRKLLDKLKEQGTQRGLMLLAPLLATKLGLSTEDTVTMMTAILAIYGTHNVITEN